MVDHRVFWQPPHPGTQRLALVLPCDVNHFMDASDVNKLATSSGTLSIGQCAASTPIAVYFAPTQPLLLATPKKTTPLFVFPTSITRRETLNSAIDSSEAYENSHSFSEYFKLLQAPFPDHDDPSRLQSS